MPARKSNAEHKKNGTYRPERHGNFEMPVEIPSAPKALSPAAKEVWDEITKVFYTAGVITQVDRTLVAVLCDSICLYRTAQRDIEKTGMTYESTGRWGTVSKSNPAISVRDNCVREIISIFRQFGLTPAARGQKPNTDTTNESHEALAGFLGIDG